MNKSLYEILGVDKDATAHQLKTAYWHRVKETHPDTGADGEEFQQVAHAYGILRDDELRAHYDATGQEGLDEVTPVMVSLISQAFMSILNEVDGKKPLKEIDFIESIHQFIEDKHDEVLMTRDIIARQLKEYEDLLKRITRDTDNGNNIFANILNEAIKNSNINYGKHKIVTEALSRALDELDHYHNEVEIIRVFSVMQYGSGFFSNQNGTNSIIIR